jgi:hydroxypyruvate isomerase
MPKFAANLTMPWNELDFLDRFDAAAKAGFTAIELIGAVGSDNLWLQYDIYHMQIMEGDLAPTLERHRGGRR